MRNWDNEEVVYLRSIAEASIKCRKASVGRSVANDDPGQEYALALVKYKNAQAELEKFYEEKGDRNHYRHKIESS